MPVCCPLLSFCFSTNPPTTEIYTLSLHDALPIYQATSEPLSARSDGPGPRRTGLAGGTPPGWASRSARDRKSTRLNSSHTVISYAVFCLKKKKKNRSKHREIRHRNVRRTLHKA